MDKEKHVSQDDINTVWRNQWASADKEIPEKFFTQRLFIEGYPIFKKYISYADKEILDAGGGTGRYGIQIARDFPESQIIISDILEESLNIGKKIAAEFALKNIGFIKDNILRSLFPDNRFDLVFSDVVIQHLPDYQEAIRELKRITKPGGTILIATNNFWNFHTLYKKILALTGGTYEYGYEKSFSKRELMKAMGKEGIQVIAVDGFYVGYGIFRLKKHHRIFHLLGRIINKLSKVLDQYTGRFFSKTFGFEIMVIGRK